MIAERRDRRAPPWLECRTCGYNLIARRVRCPECGDPIPQRTDLPRVRVVRGFVIVERGCTDAEWPVGEVSRVGSHNSARSLR
jgi:uncharacterized OB-fold protein